MNFRVLMTAVALSTASHFAITPVASAEPAIYTGRFSNVAVEGHDPVAYFKEGKPVKGSKEFTTEYMGADFRFASAENLETFLSDPAAYAPQYGGYCAWAMADGQYAKGDADYWRIVDGKLYLNFNRSIQQKWEADIPGFIEKADAQWAEKHQ